MAAPTLSELRAASPAEMKRAMAARLLRAGEIVATAVRAASGEFSNKIPASVKVVGGASGVYVIAGGDSAPSADPNEYGKRHPVFAPRGSKRYTDDKWYPTPHRPFMEEAVAAAADAAMEEFSNVIDDWCDQLGM